MLFKGTKIDEGKTLPNQNEYLLNHLLSEVVNLQYGSEGMPVHGEHTV